MGASQHFGRSECIPNRRVFPPLTIFEEGSDGEQRGSLVGLEKGFELVQGELTKLGTEKGIIGQRSVVVLRFREEILTTTPIPC